MEPFSTGSDRETEVYDERLKIVFSHTLYRDVGGADLVPAVFGLIRERTP